MNKVFLSGVIANDPSYTSSENGIERLTFQLCIKHRTVSGIIHKEYYTINAWNDTAKWAKRNLAKGGFIALQGYLTQKTIKTPDGTPVVVTSVAVDEFIIGALPSAVNIREQAAADMDVSAESDDKAVEVDVAPADTSGNIVYRSTLGYDKLSNLVQMREEVNNAANGVRVTDFTYDRDNRVTRVQYDSNSTRRVDYAYDDLGRIASRTVTNVYNAYASNYTYVDGGYGNNSTTPLVKKITQGNSQNGFNFEYEYDSRGNIVSEKRNGAETEYAYDGIGQLVRVNDPHENATWVYEYDRGGNITSKVKYAYTTGALGSAVQTISYTYDTTWKDKLVGYNGATLSYDAIGNLTGDGTWTYTWEKGRQLKQMSKSGTTIQFKYDHNGMRTQKIATVNGTTTTTNYVYRGNKLVHLTQGSYWMHFYYDGQGQPAIVNYNGMLYTYVKNLQGDVVGILDSAGNILVEYKYDAWGAIICKAGSMASTLGLCNPFRYRGYIYDVETWMYWLENRYYHPELQHFISTDALIGTIGRIIGHNLYSYCRNSPVSMGDPTGFEPRLFYIYGKDQKTHAKRNMKDLMKAYEVHGYLVTSPEDFTNAWNDMYSVVGEDDIDIVVINLHGSPDSVEYIDPDSLDYSKEIDTLVLLSCNAGHLSTGSPNIAQKILYASNSNIDKLVAADGTHYRGTLLHPFRGIRVKADATWKDFKKWNAKSKGFTLYKRDNVGGYSITSIGKTFKSVRKLLEKIGW